MDARVGREEDARNSLMFEVGPNAYRTAKKQKRSDKIDILSILLSRSDGGARET
jgi:hypothetical protein